MNNNDKIKLSQNIIIIAGIFCVVVAMLLLLNFWQVSNNDPIESKALQALVDRLKQEPNNEELKVEIRNFDLLARKAYFNSQWQVKTGAYLLLFGAIVLAFALRVYYSAKAKIEQPDTLHENEISARILAQKGIIIVGGVIFLLALGASLATVNQLNYYDSGAQVAENETSPEEQGIEVIDVGTLPQNATQDSSEVNAQNDEMQVAEPEPASAEIQETNTAPKESATEQAPVQPATGNAGLTLASVQKNHNSFRGPLGQGVIYHKNTPTKWDGASGENIVWKVSIPKNGFNSPIVWGDRIFIAGADATSREVYCFSKTDGKLLWTGKADNIQGSPAKMPKVTEDTGLAAPTMTTDGKAVFAIFANGDVIAFDMNGKRVWAKNLGVPNNHYGHSSSLITWANKLLIQFDTNSGGKLIALNTSNGEPAWETTRESKISWASPVLAEVGGKYQVILTSDPIVAGYDVDSGKELWKVECMMGEVGPSVAYSDGVVFAANEYARLVAIDVKTKNIIWENDEYLPEASSPVASKGLLFIATSYGVLVCYDAKTGDKYWEHDVGTTIYSSPTIADGKLYLMDNDGMMRIYAAAKEMKLISENDLGEKSGTTPAFDEGRIYIRGEKDLYCIGK